MTDPLYEPMVEDGRMAPPADLVVLSVRRRRNSSDDAYVSHVVTVGGEGGTRDARTVHALDPSDAIYGAFMDGVFGGLFAEGVDLVDATTGRTFEGDVPSSWTHGGFRTPTVRLPDTLTNLVREDFLRFDVARWPREVPPPEPASSATRVRLEY